jgi:hypothetical protein
MTTSTARAILAGGLVSLNVWNTVALAYDGFGAALDADKFEIKPNFEEKVSESRSHLDYGQARASVILPKPTEITIELSAANVEALAMQFQGMVQTLTQSSGNQAATDFTVTQLGVWLPLGKRNISSSGFVLTSSDASTTYTEGTHYSVNWLRGEILIIAGAAGGPAKDDVLKLAMSWGAVDGKKILGGRITQVRCQARLDGKNMVDGSPIEVDVWECVLGSSNGFDFLGSDFSAITLSGKIVTPAGKTEGYEVRFPGAST